MSSRSLRSWSMVVPSLWLLLLPSSTQSQLLDYSTGFLCNDPALNLNPGPRAFPQLIANDDNDRCTLRMSPDQVGRAVSAFASITLDNDEYAFDTTFTYELSGVMNGIGDGIAFVMHQDSRGTSALASGGGNLGVYGAGIITPAIVVELDTFRNVFGLPADDHSSAVHVTIIDGGQVFEVAEVPTTVRGGTVTVNIQSDGQTLQVFVNNIRRVSECLNPSEIFSGRNVVVGFTGGTGVSADQQDIFTWTLDNATPTTGIVGCGPRPVEVRPPSPPPVPVPPTGPSPTNAPVPMPSSMPSTLPSMDPTSQQDQLFNFWEWLLQIIEALAEYLAVFGATVPDDS